MGADFSGAFAIFSYNINRWYSSTDCVIGGAILKDRHEIFSLAGIQQVAWNGREIQKGSFHVFTILLSLPFCNGVRLRIFHVENYRSIISVEKMKQKNNFQSMKIKCLDS